MIKILHTTFAAAAVSAAILFATGPSFAYGEAVPMGVIGIEALAPVTSLDATTTETAPAETQAPVPAVQLASKLLRWIAALRQRLDGAIEVALH